MNTIKYFLIAATLIIQSSFSLRAQNTEGTEFWLTFGFNAFNYTWVDLQICIVAGNQLTEATITFTNLGTPPLHISIPAHSAQAYPLTEEQKQAVYNTTMGISNKSIHITADHPVTVYALNQYLGTADATNVLPVTALGDKYYHMGYGVGITNPSSYSVIAIHDNTQVYHNGTPTEILNSGDVYYRTEYSTDMTGAQITSNKPVAFFSQQNTVIPLEYMYGDYLFQQLAPVNTWGRIFFVPVSHLAKDIVRIVASENGTNITQIGGNIRLGVPGAQPSLNGLQAGQFVELDIALNDNGCYIIANNPVGVCAYLTCLSYHPDIPSSDPAQSWLPAIEQTISNTLITPFIPNGDTQLNEHHALVVAATATKNTTQVSIGGALPAPLSGSSWVDNAYAGMSFYNMPMTNETVSYRFTNQAGIIVMCYGVGPAEAYYYLAGSAMRELDAAFYANDIHFQDLKENPFCEGLVEFRAEIEGLHPNPNSLMWYINGTEEFSARDQLTWTKTFAPGEYEIKMWVRYENEEIISKIGTLTILSCSSDAEFYANDVHHLNLPDTTFCSNEVNFHAEIEGLDPASESLKWYIDGVEEESAKDRMEWSKTFLNGEYQIEMWVRFENGETTSVTSTLKILVPWIKIRNIRRD